MVEIDVRRHGAGGWGAAWLCLGLLVACAGGVPPVAAPASVAPRVPVVFVPGVTGTHLWDPAAGRRVWGSTRQLLVPRDGGYRLALPIEGGPGDPHPQTLYETAGPLLRLRLLGRTKPIYQPLIDHLEAEGYRRGDLEDPRSGESLFFFDYDWRRRSAEHAATLGRSLVRLAAATGRPEVDLVCQSNAAKICRYLVKRRLEGARGVRKVVLAGASGDGALRALQMLDRGRRYLPGGRRISEEVAFTIRPLFEELPSGENASGAVEALFFDEAGNPLTIDLHDPAEWERLGLSVFDARVAARLERRGREDLFGTLESRRRYLAAELAAARALHGALEGEGDLPPVRYYRLENGSLPTMARALVLREAGARRLAFLGDREIDRHPARRALATAPGDGHATLASQRRLSAGEEAAVAGVERVDGGHFEMVVEPQGLAALTRFLAD